MCSTNNSIVPEDRCSDLVNEQNEKVVFLDCDGSGIDTVVKKKVINEKLINVKGVSEIVLNDEVTDVKKKDVEEIDVKEKDEVLSEIGKT